MLRRSSGVSYRDEMLRLLQRIRQLGGDRTADLAVLNISFQLGLNRFHRRGYRHGYPIGHVRHTVKDERGPYFGRPWIGGLQLAVLTSLTRVVAFLNRTLCYFPLLAKSIVLWSRSFASRRAVLISVPFM